MIFDSRWHEMVKMLLNYHLCKPLEEPRLTAMEQHKQSRESEDCGIGWLLTVMESIASESDNLKVLNYQFKAQTKTRNSLLEESLSAVAVS